MDKPRTPLTSRRLGARPHDPVQFTQQMLDRRRRHPEASDRGRYDALFRHPAYPRAARFDPALFHFNHMGPSVLWLTEALTQHLELRAGMRVLDLGCGTALSSIVLAAEFDVQVWAVDLWVSPHDNRERIAAAGLDDQVFAIRADAHTLPFGYGFFDAVVSIGAYHYFGTAETYLPDLAGFVAEGGPIGVVVPGSSRDVDDFPTFRSPSWWRALWARTTTVDVERADMVDGGWDLWWRFLDAEALWKGGEVDRHTGDASILLSSAGAELGFTRLVVRKRTAIAR